MKIRVEVTAEDIANGRRYHASACPVALACKRVFPSDSEPYVNGLNVSFGRWGERRSVVVPGSVLEFINRFDAPKPLPVKPFSFDLDLPPYVPLDPCTRRRGCKYDQGHPGDCQVPRFRLAKRFKS